jgi:multiple sugar transport system permease protein
VTVSGPTAPADTTVESPAGPPSGGPGRRSGRGAGRSRSARAREDRRTGYLLISPTVVIVGVMVVLPILWTVSLAFQQVRLLNLRTTGIIGDFDLDNFRSVLTSPGFVEALVNTLVYSVFGTACAIGLGLVAALALRRPFRGRGLVRACMLLPYVAPVVAATFLCKTLLNSQFGLVNHYGTALLGWDAPIAFLSSSESPSLFGLDLPISTAMLTVVLFEGWRSFPFAFLFLTARMQAIPDTLDEAAIVDGAAPSQRFRHIVLPQLLPTIAVLTVLRFIWTFNNFDDIYLLTQGGAGTQVVTVRVFDYLINRGDIGAAAAQALVLAVILAVLVTVYLKLFGRREEVA